MKKWICLIWVILLLLGGCTSKGKEFQEPVTFYYPRAHETADQLDTFFAEGAIASETREAVGHRQDLNYLLRMYLNGPLEEDLLPPFSVGTQLSQIQKQDRVLNLVLVTNTDRLSHLELTLCSACLAKTCMELTDLEAVNIQILARDQELVYSGSFTESNLLLTDDITVPTDSTDETQ